MKKVINFFIIFIIFYLISQLNAASFFIEKYKVNLYLQKNSSAIIEETILVNFYKKKHGIYRYIPIKWDNKKFYIKLLSIKSSLDGKNFVKEPYKTWKEKKLFYIKIGSKNKTIKGLKYYKITYKIFNIIINKNNNNDIFYWNVIGTGWKVPIKKVNINIKFPQTINPNKLKINIFAGFYGSTNRISSYNLSTNYLKLSNISLKPQEGITIKLIFPKNFFKPISKLQITIFWLKENFGYIIPIFTLIIMLFIWFKYGKDEKKGSLVVQYKPPEQFTPAEIGTLIDDTVDKKDIIATIIDLAVKGYIKIKKNLKDGLIFDKEIFIFERTNKDGSHLKTHEKIILMGLFKHSQSITIDELKKENKFYKTVDKFKENMFNFLTEKKHFYTKNPKKIRTIFFVIGFIIMWISVPLTTFLKRGDLLIGMDISAGIIFFFGFIMPKKTKEGTKIYKKILGFKEFLKKVETPLLEKLIKEDPDFFNKILPYAIALGVEKKWIKKFKDITISPPQWYITSFSSNHFSTTNLIDSLQSDLNSLSSAISRSSGSSSSGGFSGGGAGGGGGGSW